MNFDDSAIFLPTFPSRTNLRLHNIHVMSKLVKKVVTSLDLSKACGSDCIHEAVLKKCERQLSCILAELFNICLTESCCPGCWMVSYVVSVYKNVG